MGKGDRRTARNKKPLPKLAATPRRDKKKRGGARMKQIQQEREDQAVEVVCKARARKTGSDDLRAMRHQIHGDEAGRALWASEEAEAAERLHAAYRALLGAYERYCKTSLGKSPYAKTGKIEMMSDKMETNADAPPPDTRDEVERCRAAERAWGMWSAKLRAIGIVHESAIFTAINGFAELQTLRVLTPAGRRFVDAMKALDQQG